MEFLGAECEAERDTQTPAVTETYMDVRNTINAPIPPLGHSFGAPSPKPRS